MEDILIAGVVILTLIVVGVVSARLFNDGDGQNKNKQ